MDELTQYLNSNDYEKSKLERILNKKIIITKNHIENIDIVYYCINSSILYLIIVY